MRTIFFLFFLIIVTIQAATFPEIKAKSLKNEWVELPKQGQMQLYILGFEQDSGEHMADWVRGLKLRPTENITWYQIPIIGGVPPFVDGFIMSGMRKSIKEKMYNTVLPYFGNRFEVMEAVANTSELEDKTKPFIIILDDNAQITFNIQAYATTDNIKVVQQKIKSSR